jgi:DNA-binding SARP family transcriptional activator
VGSSVGMGVETSGPRAAEGCRLRIRLLGSLEIRRDGVAMALPASRKVRALLAYLALAPREVSRPAICELLWDVPNDPRGELRWCLSKIRRLVDDPGRQRVLAREDAVQLDLADCFVDAIEVQRAMKEGAGPLGAAEAEALATL